MRPGPTAPHRDTFALVYGLACPNRCEFCCHDQEEYGRAKTSPAQAIDWIRQAADIPSIRRVIFTGGEPFLYYKEILEVMTATRAGGLPVRIVTAAHWAETEARARELLAPLKEQGLDELSVSTDPTHQEFVPVAFAENALRAAGELGLVNEVVGVFWDPKARVEDHLQVPEGTRLLTRLAAPRGRSRERRITPEDYCLTDARLLGCRGYQRYDFTVYPDGRLYPCCSGGSNIRADLALGNLREEPLAPLVDRAHADPYTRVVLSLGVAFLYEIAAHRFPEVAAKLPPKDQFLTCCDLCERLHGDPELRGLLEPVARHAEKLVDPMIEIADLRGDRPEVVRG